MVRILEEEIMDRIKDSCLELLFLLILLICIIFTILLLSPQSAEATDVSGSISTDTTWNVSGSPYIVKGDIYINEGVNLTIEPGVGIRFDGYFHMYVDGNLSAVGNDINKTTFTSNDFTPYRSDWFGITVREMGRVYVENCVISYARYGFYLDSISSTCFIKNCTFFENQYGIYSYLSSNLTVTNTNVSINSYGIYISYSSNITVNGSILLDNYYRGIALYYSQNCCVMDCNVSENDYDGIEISQSSNITINNVKLYDNGDENLDLNGDQKYHYSHQITNTIVNGKPLIFYFDVKDITIEQLEDVVLIIAWGDYVAIDNCSLTYGAGISLYYTTNSTITRCNVSDCDVGIYLESSAEYLGIEHLISNTISNNTFSNNTYGIKLYYSLGNEIRDNDFISNEYGIYSTYSYTNWIFHNNFIGNQDQVYATGSYLYSNYWDNGEEGNFWSDYYGSDLGGDGIGDSPYTVRSGVDDNFPLMQLYTGSLPPDTTPPFFRSYNPPTIHDRTLTFPRDDLTINFRTSELGYYEIILDSDGIEGFDNTTDITLRGNTTMVFQNVEWNGRDDEGNFIENGEYEIQIMIWDRAGNPIEEPYDAGSVYLEVDSDLDGVLDVDDAFPHDSREWDDFDGDGIGDNSDPDLDNDGVPNHEDVFPRDRSEWADADGDGIGDNEDPDDNDNGISDVAEIPLALIIIIIPFAAIYLTNRHLKSKKSEEE